MKNFINFLCEYLDRDSHISLNGQRVTIHEADRCTKLPDVDVCFAPTSSIFAFVMDRKQKRICDKRKKGCQKRKDKANALNSKIYTFLESNPGMHVGCDGIIVAEEDDQIRFYVCELKSKNVDGFQAKFKMARALIMYLCEAAKVAGITFSPPRIYFFLFKVVFGKKTGTNVSSKITALQNEGNFPYMAFEIPACTTKQFRVVDVTQHEVRPHSWQISIS